MSTRSSRALRGSTREAVRVVCSRSSAQLAQLGAAHVRMVASRVVGSPLRRGPYVALRGARVGAARDELRQLGRVRVRGCVVRRPRGAESHGYTASLVAWRFALDDARNGWRCLVRYDLAALVMLARFVADESETRWREDDVAYAFCASVEDVSRRRHTPRMERELTRYDQGRRDETRDPTWCPVLHRQRAVSW